MRIWHFGASSSMNIVNGANWTVWQVAAYQARLGHQVEVWLDFAPDESASQFAREFKMATPIMRSGPFGIDPEIARRMKSQPPDVAHMHSVFVPRQAFIARSLGHNQIPYVITPNGGVAPQVLARGRTKKFLYSALVEKRRFAQAAAISAVMPAEIDEIRSFCPGLKAPIVHIDNPVDCGSLAARSWRGINHPHRIVYLGRFDIFHKGLDILAEITRSLPEIEFVLFGEASRREERAFGQLREQLPANVQVRAPVYGVDKVKALQGADIYIHPSRWEAFGISIAEAMCLGVPCAISGGAHMHRIFADHNLGLVLDGSAHVAAKQLRDALNAESTLQTWSSNASQYAVSHFDAPAVAGRFLVLYDRIILSRGRVSVP